MTTPNAKEGHQAASINSILPKEQSVNYVLLQNTRAYTENDYVSDVLLVFVFTKASNDCTCVTDLYITISLPLSCGLWGFFYIYILPMLSINNAFFLVKYLFYNINIHVILFPLLGLCCGIRGFLYIYILPMPSINNGFFLKKKIILQIFTYKYISSFPPIQVCAVASWDSSIHDSQHLNRITGNDSRVYLIVKVPVSSYMIKLKLNIILCDVPSTSSLVSQLFT